MKRVALLLTITLGFAVLGFSSAPQTKPSDQAALDAVLKKLDAVAAKFSSAEANFEWDTYEKVINEVDDVKIGTIYYRRSGKDIEMMADVKKAGDSTATTRAESEQVLYANGKVQMYQPKLNRVTQFDLGKSHSDFESYVVLGFGGSGQELQKAFDVSYVGKENLNGIETDKLKLVPKSQKVRNTYSEIYLWIDPDRGVSVQQQFFQPQGDYRLAKYSDIQVNGRKIPEEVFKLRTNGKTEYVSPSG